MIKIKFKIIKRKDIPIDFPDDMARAFPSHEDYLTEGEIIYVEYQFKPTRETENNIDAFKVSLLQFLKSKYNTSEIKIL